MIEESETAKAPGARPWRLGLLAIVLVAGLATYYWIDLRQRLSGTQHELATRLRAAEDSAREASSVARAALLEPGLLRGLPLFVPHDRVADEARRLGVRQVRVAGPGDDEMFGALVAYFETR